MSTSNSKKKEPVTGWLVIINGHGLGHVFQLGFGVQKIGRNNSQEIAIRFNDHDIALEKHALIEYDAKHREFYLFKGESLTYLNNKRVRTGEKKTLCSGDIIRLGRTILRFMPLCCTEFDWDISEVQEIGMEEDRSSNYPSRARVCFYQVGKMMELEAEHRQLKQEKLYASLFEFINNDDTESIKQWSLSGKPLSYKTLGFAIEVASFDTIKALLELGSDPFDNQFSNDGFAYGIAMILGRSDIVKLLAEQQIPLTEGQYHESPLHIAMNRRFEPPPERNFPLGMAFGNLNQNALDYHPNLANNLNNHFTQKNYTPNRIKAFETYIELGGDVNWTSKYGTNDSIFLSAARLGLLPILQACFKGKVNLKQVYDNRYSALDLALNAGQIDCANYLKEKGVDFNADNINLSILINLNEIKWIQDLLPLINPTEYNLKNWLSNALYQSNEGIFNLLIKLPNAVNCVPQEVLIFCASTETEISYQITKENHSEQDAHGMPSIHHAVKTNDRTLLKNLLALGVNINVTNNDNQSALFYAYSIQKWDWMQFLLDSGANPAIGQSMFKHAMLNDDLSSIKKLVSIGISPDTIAANGKPAIRDAIMYKKYEILKYLISAGASLDYKSQKGSSLYEFAVEYSDDKTIAILEKVFFKKYTSKQY